MNQSDNKSKPCIQVLFVCMGNICRSPTAEGVTLALVKRAGMTHLFEIDSAGTHSYHIGKPPDARAIKTAAQRGYDLQPLRARRVSEEDFARFDYILAMDRDNLALLKQACPDEHQGKLALFLEFGAGRANAEVPDPYYGGEDGFERVLDMVEEAATGLLDRLGKR